MFPPIFINVSVLHQKFEHLALDPPKIIARVAASVLSPENSSCTSNNCELLSGFVTDVIAFVPGVVADGISLCWTAHSIFTTPLHQQRILLVTILTQKQFATQAITQAHQPPREPRARRRHRASLLTFLQDLKCPSCRASSTFVRARDPTDQVSHHHGSVSGAPPALRTQFTARYTLRVELPARPTILVQLTD